MRRSVWLLVATLVCSAGCSQVLGLDSYGPAPADSGAVAVDAAQDSTSGSGSESPGADSGGADHVVDVGLDGSSDGAAPSAAISATAIDFGTSPCGAAAPPDRSVAISNVGGSPLVWQAALDTTASFAIAGAAGGTVAPGASANVALAAQSVPTFAVAGNTEQATLTINTNDPSRRVVSLPVKLTAGGASLVVVPTSAAFGDVSVGTGATPIPVALTNTGNLPATVGFVQPSDKAFTLGWTGAPASVVVPPGGMVPGLVANFLPAALGSVATTVGITTSGAMCGTSPSTIGMTGTGSSGLVTVQPGILDFGFVDCGTQAPAKALTIHNTGTASIGYRAALTTGGAYVVSPASGSIGAGASVTVTVTPNSIPAASSVAPNGYGDTLTVTTTAAGDTPHAIALQQTARGAILSQSASSILFGPVAVGTTAASQFTVSNSGNASASVSFATQATAFAVNPQAQTVGSGSSYTPIVSFTPAAATTYMDTATMTVASGTVLCATLPAGVGLTGSGMEGTAVDVGPTNLDFGLVDCASAAPPQTVTIKNDGTASFNWSAAVKTHAYGLTPAGGSLAPRASAIVTVTPAAIPATSSVMPDRYADTLTITTDAPGDAPHAVAIHQTAQGAILSFNPGLLTMNSVQIGESTQSTFNVVNNGNLSAAATLSLSGSPAFHLAPTSVGVSGAGGASSATVTFAPQSHPPQSATVSVSTSTALCGPLPSPLVLSGKAGGD